MSLSSDAPSVDAGRARPASHTPPTPGQAATVSGANLRLALILASIAAAFFAGIVVKYVFFPAP